MSKRRREDSPMDLDPHVTDKISRKRGGNTRVTRSKIQENTKSSTDDSSLPQNPKTQLTRSAFTKVTKKQKNIGVTIQSEPDPIYIDSDSDFEYDFSTKSVPPIKRQASKIEVFKPKESSQNKTRVLNRTKTKLLNTALDEGKLITQWAIPAIPLEKKALISKLEKHHTGESVHLETFSWADKYAPRTEDELGVHPRKFAEVRAWLEAAFSQKTSGIRQKPPGRLLTLTGPAGSGKTAVIKVLSQQMNFEILEWNNPLNENTLGQDIMHSDNEYIPALRKFHEFIARANKYPSLSNPLPLLPQDSLRPQSTPLQMHKIILIEDIPNLSTSAVQKLFHDILRQHISSSRSKYPLVLIASDTSIRGSDESVSTGWRSKLDNGVMNLRDIVPPDVLNSPFSHNISFNPIAHTIMIKVLTRIAALERSRFTNLSADHLNYLNAVSESSNGDIRSALNSMQFLTLKPVTIGSEMQKKPKGRPKKYKDGAVKKKRKKGDENAIEEGGVIISAGTESRESSLSIFHALGKILYCKRLGDEDEDDDEDYDERISKSARRATPLPSHLSHWHREPLKSLPDSVLNSISVDHDIFTMYLHQNYPRFMTEIEECADASDWLSQADDLAKGGGWENSSILSSYSTLITASGLMFSHTQPIHRGLLKIYKPDYWNAQRSLRLNLSGIKNVIEHLRMISSQSDYGIMDRYPNESMSIELLPYLSIINQRRIKLRSHYQHPVLHTLNKNHVQFLNTLKSYTSRQDKFLKGQSLGERDDDYELEGIKEDEDCSVEGSTVADNFTENETAPSNMNAKHLLEDDIEDF